jgi:hypothetical protein
MRFVPVKTEEQQAALSLHRARQGFVRQRTAQANQIRGLLAEFGVVIPQGIRHICKHLGGCRKHIAWSIPTIAAATWGTSETSGRTCACHGGTDSAVAWYERGKPTIQSNER